MNTYNNINISLFFEITQAVITSPQRRQYINAIFLGLPGKPGVPQITDVSGSTMLVEWRAPSDDGGCDIEGYILEYKMDGAFKHKKASKKLIPDLKFKVSDLMDDMTYEFRVAAENKAGVGPFSSGSAPIKASVPLGG